MTAPDRIWAAGRLGEYGRYYPEAVEAEGEHGGHAVEYVRADIVDELAQALGDLEGYIPLEPVDCCGDQCRDPWCISCYGEGYAETALKLAMSRAMRARAALARYRGGV